MTGYDSLDVFLTSAEQKVDFTVSTGPGPLTQEPGNAVKHLNWPIPESISPASEYEVTLTAAIAIDSHDRRLNPPTQGHSV